VVTLSALFKAIELSALNAVLTVMATALIGQDIASAATDYLVAMGPRSAAYVMVIAAIQLVLSSKRLVGATLMFTAATYVHFLVGGF
jgi:hypothetical protein